MDKKQQAEIKELINREIEKTKNLIADYKEMSGPVARDNAIGRVSRMDAINNKSVTEAALRTAQNKLKGLKEALKNIDKKDFGKCAKCQNEIPIQRILLMPHGRFCVNCAR
jgi:DnaK suppressor protein